MTSSSDFVALCSDDEVGDSNGENLRKGSNSVSGKSRLKRKYKTKEVIPWELKKQSVRQESVEDRSSNVFSDGQSDSTLLDQVGSPVDESSLSSASPLCAAPVCRQFWKAGNYVSGQFSKAATENGKNHLCIHPMFLHSNATSHKWVFGAIAELLDNAVDEIQNGATFVSIDKTSNPRDGSPALLIQDDGGGMDPEAIRRCMSFGFSDKKLKIAIGQYGNGFKTSSMRLGADAIVFSRHIKERTLTQSIGLLSYTFLRQTGQNRVVVPLVDYEFNASANTFQGILPHGEEHFSSNLSILMQWSPYSTEEELLKQFDDIGHHGTKIVVYNLWLNDEGTMELDFNSDPEDIRIHGELKLFQANSHSDPIRDKHVANQYRYSLRAYSSILYLRIPQTFRIFLRGRIVDHHSIANDIKYPEFILYKPQLGGNLEAAVFTTIGFWKDCPRVNFHGFSIYHRNRLILPFWSVVKVSNGVARGVVGVLEANFIEPTHDKQDFEKTSLFQKLEARLKDMALEYWHLHCGILGYQQTKKNPPSPLPPQNVTHTGQEHPVFSNSNTCETNSSRKAFFGVESLQDSETTPLHVSTKRPRHSIHNRKMGTQPELIVKQQEDNPVAELGRREKHTGSGACITNYNHNGVAQPGGGTENHLQNQETMNLLQENEKLKSQLLEIEKREELLSLKVQRLRSELEDVQRVYVNLLAGSKSMDIIKDEKC